MSTPPSDYNAVPPSISEATTYAAEDSFGSGDRVVGTGAAAPAAGVAESPGQTWPGRTEGSPVGRSVGGLSTSDVAKDEAGNVKDTAVDAGKNVAATAKDEAANVVGETKQQAKTLLASVTSELETQAGAQQRKIAEAVRDLSRELGGMAYGSSESGPLTDLAHQATQKSREIAIWLDNREPRDVLREVQSFARRRPVMFLALCGLAGVVAGRITRGAVAANTSIDSPSVERGTPDSQRLELNSAPPASIVEEVSTVDATTRPAALRDIESPGYSAVEPGEQFGGVR